MAEPNRLYSHPEKLIIVAIVVNKQAGSSADDIYKWILRRFGYHAQGFGGKERLYHKFGSKAFEDALSDAELDLCESMARFGKWYFDGPDSARVFLQRWLEPERTYTFCFLDPPPDLRNRIYNMILTFDERMVFEKHHSKSKANLLLTRWSSDTHRRHVHRSPSASIRKPEQPPEHIAGVQALASRALVSHNVSRACYSGLINEADGPSSHSTP